MQTTRRALLGSATALATWGCASKTTLLATNTAGRSGRAVTRLDANESPYGPGPAARAALRDAIDNAGRYSDLGDELIAAIAKRHGVTSDHVVVGTGSFAILEMVSRMALRDGGSAVLADPTFPGTADCITILGRKIARVPVDKRAVHDLDAMNGAIGEGTRLAYVCNPNNPTGTIAPASDVAAFCTRNAARTLVMVDEAYADYVDDPRYGSMDDLVRRDVPIVVVRSFSKLFGLAGLRVGYALAPPSVIKNLRKVRPANERVWVSGVGASAALASLGDAEFIRTVRQSNASVRAKFVGDLERLGLTVPASQTNFVFFTPPGKPDAMRVALADRGVRISGRDELGGCRVSIGLPGEMAAATDAIAAVLQTSR
ncbi:MAG: histidinol-phosphate transaminase [Polyangiaceae bacterium]